MGKFIINPKMFNHYYMREKVNLNSKLYPTGFEHQYDCIVGFVKKWVLSLTGEDFFKNIYVNESISYKRIKRKTQLELLKYDNPQIVIIPRIDSSFNRDTIDLYQRGIETLQLSRIDESLIRDTENKSYIGMHPRQIKIDFDIKIKLSTKVQQLKLFELLKLGLKSGSTQDIYEPTTFQIPFELISEMYSKLFDKELKENSLEDSKEIVDYINSHSITPVKYDKDLSSGRYHFYIDVTDYDYHIVFLDDISIDDGEREGHTYNNYMIEFSFSVYGACPAFYYWFYSDKSKVSNYIYSYENNKVNDNRDSLEIIHSINEFKIPEKYNNQDLYLSVQITDVPQGDFTIYISDIKEGLGFSDQLMKVIDYCTSRHINPSVCVSFLTFFMGIRKDIEVDWFNDKIIVKDIPLNCVLDFAVYVDKLYVNKILADIKLNS